MEYCVLWCIEGPCARVKMRKVMELVGKLPLCFNILISICMMLKDPAYLYLKIIGPDVRESPADVRPERLFQQGVLLPWLEAVRTEFLLPGVLHEAVALCGHRCFTAATAKVPLHHHPERKEVK